MELVLGRTRGLRIGEAPDRDGQYFHYLAMWLFALARLGDVRREYRERGIELARSIHPAFVIPHRGVIWKMNEELTAPYPGTGLGAMDAYDGYVAYRLLDEHALAAQIAEMRELIERSWQTLEIGQDLGLGMMLWPAHFSERALGRIAIQASATRFGQYVDRSARLLLSCTWTNTRQVCIHQLRRVSRITGGRRVVGARG